MFNLNLAAPTPGKRIAIRVSPAAERNIREGHPWLFADSIRDQSREGNEGDLAIIFDRKGRFLAVGLFDPHSGIRVRILQHGQPATINPNWFNSKLENALRLRQNIDMTHTDAYRVLHGENDGFPGLVIDRYAKTLVAKLYTLAWLPYLSPIMGILFNQIEVERLVLRFSRLVQQRAMQTYKFSDGQVVFGPPVNDAVLFRENGLILEADVINGQKTGFFLDQRENRERVEKLADGLDVLNVFAYTGGFSLYAARGGARKVTSLDLNQPALSTALKNFQHNEDIDAIRQCPHEILSGDAFLLLNDLSGQKRLFDMVILDPPSFARRKIQVAKALEAYFALISLGLGVLRPNGLLVSASCSSQVSAEAFFDVVHKAADRANRPLIEIERSYHPVDHPIGFPEGAYLKCLFARVG